MLQQCYFAFEHNANTPCSRITATLCRPETTHVLLFPLCSSLELKPVAAWRCGHNADTLNDKLTYVANVSQNLLI